MNRNCVFLQSPAVRMFFNCPIGAKIRFTLACSFYFSTMALCFHHSTNLKNFILNLFSNLILKNKDLDWWAFPMFNMIIIVSCSKCFLLNFLHYEFSRFFVNVSLFPAKFTALESFNCLDKNPCGRFSHQVYPYATPDKYISCLLSTCKLLTCAPGTYFDPIAKTCRWAGDSKFC